MNRKIPRHIAMAIIGQMMTAARTPVVKVTLPDFPVELVTGNAVSVAEFEAPAAISFPVVLKA